MDQAISLKLALFYIISTATAQNCVQQMSSRRENLTSSDVKHSRQRCELTIVGRKQSYDQRYCVKTENIVSKAKLRQWVTLVQLYFDRTSWTIDLTEFNEVFFVEPRNAWVAYLLDEWEQRFLDGARFNLRKMNVDVGQAGGRHGWRGRDCAGAHPSLAALVTWRRRRPQPARRKREIACLRVLLWEYKNYCFTCFILF